MDDPLTYVRILSYDLHLIRSKKELLEKALPMMLVTIQDNACQAAAELLSKGEYGHAMTLLKSAFESAKKAEGGPRRSLFYEKLYRIAFILVVYYRALGSLSEVGKYRIEVMRNFEAYRGNLGREMPRHLAGSREEFSANIRKEAMELESVLNRVYRLG